MKLSLILLHFKGINSLSKGYLSTIIGQTKGVSLLVFVVALYSFFTKGFDGVKAYFDSIDLALLAILVTTIFVVLLFFAFISIWVINFLASVKYCKENNLEINEFYSLPESEILKLWGYSQ